MAAEVRPTALLLALFAVSCERAGTAPAETSTPPSPAPPMAPATPPAGAPSEAPPSTAPASPSSSVPSASAARAASGIFSFDADPAGSPPRDFAFGLTGEGKPGRWVVEKQPDAPSSPNVLAQLDADSTDYRFPVAVADAPSLTDVRVSVRCKMVSGKVDQACGLVLRYQDAKNYYVTRANALEGNVRFYFVKDGKRKQLASWSGKIAAGAWHDYRIEAKGNRFQVFWNDAPVIDHRDTTFSAPGKIGVWTKADSVTYFDDLRADAL